MSSIKNSGCWPTKSQVCARSIPSTSCSFCSLIGIWQYSVSRRSVGLKEGPPSLHRSSQDEANQWVSSRKKGHLCASNSAISVPGMRSLRSTIFETSAVRSSVSAQMISGFSRSSLPLRPGTTFRTSCSPLSVSGRWSVWSGSLHFQSECAR